MVTGNSSIGLAKWELEVASKMRTSILAITESGEPQEVEMGNFSLKKKEAFDAEMFNIDIPWSPQIYFSVRGAENFHIYLWICKDIGWSQDWLVWSLFFGFCALTWCLVLGYHAIREKNFEELYMLCALILWLFGNFWWMYGEVVNDDDSNNSPQTNHMFVAALSWIAFYHVILRPFKLIHPDENMTIKYEAAGLKSRFSYFVNWRQYEHAHTLFWLGKDYSWNALDPYTWVCFFIPTFLIGLDFIYVTFSSKWMMIDCAHYIAQLMWVLGNMCWALGEIYFPEDDDYAFSMWDSTSSTRANFRWWSSWVLLAAFIPILCLYFIWLPLTCMGMIKSHSDNCPVTRASQLRSSSRAESENRFADVHMSPLAESTVIDRY